MNPRPRPRPRRARHRAPVAAVLTAVLLSTALLAAACGGDDGGSGSSSGDKGGECPTDALSSAKEPVQIKVWHGISGLAAITLGELAEKYNASQKKVKVTVESQGNYEEELKKYTDALRDPASLPDVMLAEDTTTRFMIDSGSVIPADDCIAADPKSKAIYDDLMPAVAAGYSVKGTMYPAAFGMSTPVLYYNKAHFTEAGLDPEKPPATLEEIRAAAEKIKAARPGTEPMVFRADAWWMENLETRAGQELVNADNGRSGLATRSELVNDETKGFIDWMKSMQTAGLLKTIAYKATFDAYLRMANQNASMLIETSTAATTIDALINGTLQADQLGLQAGADLSGLKFPDLKVGVGQLPGPGSAGSGQVGGNAWYIIKGATAERIAAAWDFVKWFNRTENQALWTVRGSYLPVHSKVAESPEVQDYFTSTQPGAWLATAYHGLDTIDPKFPGPVIGPYKEFRTSVRTMLENILINGADPTASLDAADTTFQTALDEYKKDLGG